MANEDLEFKMSEEDLELIYLLRKTKKVKRIKIFITILLCSAIAVVLSWYVITHPKIFIYLKSETVTTELGEQVSINKKDYLDTEQMDSTVIDDLKMTSSLISNKDSYSIIDNKYVVSKDKEYLDIGTYTLKFTYSNEEKALKLKVVDTTKPVFEVFNKKIEVEEDTKEIKWADYFQATDLTEVTLDVDDSELKLNKAGKYSISVTATDTSGNSITKKATVTVTAKPEPTPVPKQNTSSSSSSSSSNRTYSNSNSSSSSQSSTQTYQAPAQQQVQSHGSQSFMFSSGYDMDSGYQACVGAMNSIGYGTCTPIQDADGIYTGYQLNY